MGSEPVGGPFWMMFLEGTFRPVERGAHAGVGFLEGPVTLWETHTGAGCAGSTAPCGRMTYIAAVCGKLIPLGWTHTGEVHGDLYPVGGTPHWDREKTPEQQQEQHVMN